MYLPRTLYEILPFLYIILALVGIFMPEKAGRACGVVLLFAAFQILKMRRDYRRQFGAK